MRNPIHGTVEMTDAPCVGSPYPSLHSEGSSPSPYYSDYHSGLFAAKFVDRQKSKSKCTAGKQTVSLLLHPLIRLIGFGDLLKMIASPLTMNPLYNFSYLKFPPAFQHFKPPLFNFDVVVHNFITFLTFLLLQTLTILVNLKLSESFSPSYLQRVASV